VFAYPLKHGFVSGFLYWLAAVAFASEPVLPAAAQEGDLIFRRGTEMVSNAVMAVDGGQFSHVGMLVGDHGHWQVVHATPAEVPGREDGVVLDTLAFFLDPARSEEHAIYKVQATFAQRQNAVRYALKEIGKPFRVKDSSGTYCTILVWQAWQRAGVDLQVNFTYVAIPLMRGDYLLPSALRVSPQLQHLAEIP